MEWYKNIKLRTKCCRAGKAIQMNLQRASWIENMPFSKSKAAMFVKRTSLPGACAKRMILMFAGVTLLCGERPANAQLSPPASPIARMVFDSARNETVLFVPTQPNPTNSQTWVWQGSSWSLKSPAHSPGGLHYPAMAFDSIRQQVVLFGGWMGAGIFTNQTWIWDGTDWTLKNPTNKPGVRDGHSMVYDAVHGNTVLFGGWNGSDFLNDTWTWDGTNWIAEASATSPLKRNSSPMVYDEARQEVVMFGGSANTGGGATYQDTWVWNGTNWNQKSPTTIPPVVQGQAVAFDTVRREAIFFGGFSSGVANQRTWAWNGTNWAERLPLIKPAPRSQSGAAYDQIRSRIVLFGGQDNVGNGYRDTWFWNGTNWSSTGEIYVCNSGDDTVSVIALTTSTVVKNIAVGHGPHAIIFTPDGSKAYVANQLTNTISVIHTSNDSVIATIPVGSQPAQIAVSRDSRYVYVANTGSSTISLIDAATDTVITNVPTPQSSPITLAFHPIRDEVWVGYQGELGAIEARSAANLGLLASHTSLANNYASYDLAFLPDGSEAYGAEGCGFCGQFNRISGIYSGPAINIIGGPLMYDNQGFALAVAVNPTNSRVYFAKAGQNGGSPRVVEFDRSPTPQFGRTINFSAPPADLAVTPDGRFLLVANEATAGFVSVIDTTTFTSTTTVNVGRDPIGIAVKPPDPFPQVIAQPQSQTAVAGALVTFGVAAIGSAPLAYQWFFNGTNLLAGVNNSTLSLTNVQVANSGNYSVVVSNAFGVVTSAVATLTVFFKTVYVCNSGDDTVSVISPHTLTVVTNIPVGHGPGFVIFTPDGSKAYVANRLTNTISVIRASDNSVIATISVGSQPTQIAVSRDSRFVYVANRLSSTISIIDTATDTVITNVPTAQSFPITLAIHPVRDEVWVGYNSGQGGGGAIEARSATNLALLASHADNFIYYASSDLAFLPDGSEAYGAEGCGDCGRFNRISGVYSGGAVGIIEETISTSGQGVALAVAVNPFNQRVYFAQQKPQFGGNNRVTEFDRGSRFGRTINFSAPPADLAVTPDGKILLVANQATAGFVSVIDATTFTPMTNVNVGNSPSGIAVKPDLLAPPINAPPVATLTSPEPGGIYTNPAAVRLAATASDPEGQLASVSFYSGSTILFTITTAPFDILWTPSQPGSHSLTAVATDASGQSSTSTPPVNITVTTAVPEVLMISPTNGNSFIAPANILLRALVDDADSSVAWVDFYNGVTRVSSVTNSRASSIIANYTWPAVGDGSYLLYAVAHDAYGPVVTSSPISVTVGTIATNVPTFRWSNSMVSVSEASGSVTLHVFKNPNSAPATIGYSTRDSSATASGAPPDYDVAVSNLTFAAGETVKPVTIAIRQDSKNESNQFFFVSLSTNEWSVADGQNEARVTIIDDEIPGTDSYLDQFPPGPRASPLGNLRLNLSPSNIFAQWKLSWEPDWRDSGTILRGMAPGNYEVEFKPVAGFVEPLATVVPVAGGVTNDHPFTYSDSFASQIGSLAVRIGPVLIANAENVNERGQWRRQGEATWHESGEAIDGLPAGGYVIEFKPVSDPAWRVPAPVAVAVRADIKSEVRGDYYVANTSPGGVSILLNDDLDVNTTSLTPPYPLVGQIHSDLGWGSGTVVKERVVLTAAHVVFNDYELADVSNGSVKWLFQRGASAYEPAPQTPRGWFKMDGYAARRTLDALPGVSSAAAQELDVAALYFGEAAGRGGYSGYLVSTANELITAAPLATIVGYPVEGVPASARGQMHATPLRRIQWDDRAPAPHVFATTTVKTYPGNSGGPLCIESTDNKWFPAGIFLGGSGNTVVRVIDGAIAGLINEAERAGDDSGNATGGEPPRRGMDCPNCSSAIYGYLEVQLQPTNIIASGGGYRFKEAINGAIFRDTFNRFVVLANRPWTLEFLPAPYSIAPANRTIRTAAGHTNRVLATYKPWGQMQTTGTNYFLASGSSGMVYRIDFKPALGTSAWVPVRTQTVGGAGITINSLPSLAPGATNTNFGFFRAVLLP